VALFTAASAGSRVKVSGFGRDFLVSRGAPLKRALATPFHDAVQRLLRALVTAGCALLGASANASVQSCNTRCQSAQTDCALRCDGKISCIQECQAIADACAEACVKLQ
jgi:hypothetical protein